MRDARFFDLKTSVQLMPFNKIGLIAQKAVLFIKIDVQDGEIIFGIQNTCDTLHFIFIFSWFFTPISALCQ